jgi:membrane fusion protein, multidrug efflux system
MTPRYCIAVVALFAALLAACSGGDTGGGPPKSKAFPVEVETVVGREVQYVVSAVGSVEAFEEVQITARVQGVVEKINFKEGQAVTPDTVLVEIEPARFQYASDAAKAGHDRAVAEHTEAVEGLKRRENPGEKPGIFSREEVEAWRTKVAVAAAVERERAAELSQAELDLQNATPRPPMKGVIQSRLVSTGQWVTPGTVIARLLRREPMLLRFAVPEEKASQLDEGIEARFSLSGEKKEYKAVLTHVAASADVSTRMVQVIAEVQGEQDELTPGSFIRVTVPVGSNKNAPTVPESAVRPSENGFLVYVVKDNKAFQRVIEIGLRTEEQSEDDEKKEGKKEGRIEVLSGLEIGEVVVTRGAEALREGAEVAVSGAGKGGGKPIGAKP